MPGLPTHLVQELNVGTVVFWITFLRQIISQFYISLQHLIKIAWLLLAAVGIVGLTCVTGLINGLTCLPCWYSLERVKDLSLSNIRKSTIFP